MSESEWAVLSTMMHAHKYTRVYATIAIHVSQHKIRRAMSKHFCGSFNWRSYRTNIFDHAFFRPLLLFVHFTHSHFNYYIYIYRERAILITALISILLFVSSIYLFFWQSASTLSCCILIVILISHHMPCVYVCVCVTLAIGEPPKKFFFVKHHELTTNNIEATTTKSSHMGLDDINSTQHW